MKPTRIIQKPYLTSGRKREGYTIVCDNGESYRLNELAKIIGISQASLGGRIKKYGWHSKMVFHNGQIRASRKDDEDYQESPYKLWEPGDLAHLSDTHNRYGVRVYNESGRRRAA